MWSYWVYVRGSRKFSREVSHLIDTLNTCEEFLKGIVASGGQAMLIIELQGCGNIGDVLPVSQLAGLSRNSLSLGIEVFSILED